MLNFRRKKELDDAAETAHDQPHYNGLSKKEKKMIDIYDEPLLPKLCKYIFIGMLAVTGGMLLVDIKNFIASYWLGALHLFTNLSVTGFYSFVIFSAFLLPLSILGAYQSGRRYYKEKEKSGIIDETEEEVARSKRAVARLNKPFYTYEFACVLGLGGFGLLYLITSLLN